MTTSVARRFDAPTGLLFVGAAIAIVSMIWTWPWKSVEAERAACDKAVATLLATHDLVELERAAALIRALDCSVSRRLPR
jgi:hypothetical protein